MVKYLSFQNCSFALRYDLMEMARPQCDTPLVLSKFIMLVEYSLLGGVFLVYMSMNPKPQLDSFFHCT
jgi:hypothetical protein